MKYKLWLKMLVRCGLLLTLVGVSGISTASGGGPRSASPEVAQHAGCNSSRRAGLRPAA